MRDLRRVSFKRRVVVGGGGVRGVGSLCVIRHRFAIFVRRVQLVLRPL